jgi:hypothetical protein
MALNVEWVGTFNARSPNQPCAGASFAGITPTFENALRDADSESDCETGKEDERSRNAEGRCWSLSERGWRGQQHHDERREQEVSGDRRPRPADRHQESAEAHEAHAGKDAGNRGDDGGGRVAGEAGRQEGQTSTCLVVHADTVRHRASARKAKTIETVPVAVGRLRGVVPRCSRTTR